jgi:hypothetical protein
VEVLELKNKSMLSKWLFKLINEQGLLQEFLQNKYLKNKTLSQLSAKPTDSHFSKGLMAVKDDSFIRGSMKVENGQNTKFWEDTLAG